MKTTGMPDGKKANAHEARAARAAGPGLRSWSILSVAALCGLSSCAQPIVPTVMVLPPPGKDFAAFQLDQHDCSIYANDQIRPLVERAATAQIGTALIGTALGAGLGASVGRGRGAGVGAAAGALAGAGVGADQAAQTQNRLQASYDGTYAGCMTARGDVVQAPPAPQVTVVAPQPVIVQPAPYVVQPAPYVAGYVTPAP